MPVKKLHCQTFYAQKRPYETIFKKKSLKTRLQSISLFVEKKHLFDEVVLLSIEKYLQGHLRRGEFRVGSNRKIQRHLSFGTSGTMAWGGGPRSRQPSSVSRVLIFRLNTLSCFGSPPIILQILLVIGCDQLLSPRQPLLHASLGPANQHCCSFWTQHRWLYSTFPTRTKHGQHCMFSPTLPVGFSQILNGAECSKHHMVVAA